MGEERLGATGALLVVACDRVKQNEDDKGNVAAETKAAILKFDSSEDGKQTELRDDFRVIFFYLVAQLSYILKYLRLSSTEAVSIDARELLTFYKTSSKSNCKPSAERIFLFFFYCKC